MKIIDSYPLALTSFENSGFSFERWKGYIDSALPGIYQILVEDVKGALRGGEISEDSYLSALNGAAQNKERLEAAHESFLKVTDGLENIIFERFGKSLDVVVAFYLGLCNGAGWVTEYRGKTAILLGMEKISELNWCGVDDMRGLICHELGHVYQKQYGTLHRSFDNDEDSFLWQLFTEGVAMCFEQAVVGDPEYYHQNKNGWKSWCDDNFERIKRDFAKDLKTMSSAARRYFGDWVDYNGRGDVGYYLGARFVRYILSEYDFDEIVCFDIAKVKEMFDRFEG